MVNLVVIIARAGSKGLPNKAMALLAGKPLVAWTIEHAQGSKLTTAVALTSDGPDILAVGRKYGIHTYLRPPHRASDAATIDDGARHGVEEWERQHGRQADNVVILYGNIPLRPADLTDRALSRLIDTGADSVQSVYPVGKMHPYWMKKLGGPGGDVLEMYQPNTVYRRQDLPPVYMLDGGIIAVTRGALFGFDPTGREPHRFLGADRRAIVTQSGDVVDVDDPLDLILAEAIVKLRGGGGG